MMQNALPQQRQERRISNQLGTWTATMTAALLVATLGASTATPSLADTTATKACQKTEPLGGERCRQTQKCRILDNTTGYTLARNAQGDVLFKVLSEQAFCPENALGFRKLLEKEGMKLHPAMVANRGYHNPLPAGSFSFFEAVTGDFAGEILEFGDFFVTSQ